MIRLDNSLVLTQCTGNSSCFPLGKRAAIVRSYPVFSLCVQCFRVSVIHRTLTWTTGSLMCVSDHSYACVYTRVLGTPTTIQHNSLTRKNGHNLFLCSGRGSNLWSSDLEPMLYRLSHPVDDGNQKKMDRLLVFERSATPRRTYQGEVS